jgi:lipid-binding SYLF domain-containing protein
MAGGGFLFVPPGVLPYRQPTEEEVMHMRPNVWTGLLIACSVALAGCQTPSSDVQLPRRPTKSELQRDSKAALDNLYAAMPFSKTLAPRAKAVLVFPRIVKAGMGIGGQFGDGVLYAGGKVAGYYNTAGASYGLQLGAQRFGYALFFMTAASLQYLKETDGWEVGVGPSLVVVDEGMAKTLTTTTAKEDIYAFIFGQEGLMAGLGIQGNKITPINPAP